MSNVAFETVPEEVGDEAIEQELIERFDPERLSALCDQYLESGTGINLKELVGDRKFVVGIIPATSEYADIGRSVETLRFAKVFKRPASVEYKEYSEYDDTSDFIVAIDVKGEKPVPAGEIRVIRYDQNHFQKSIVDLVIDSPKNPWIDEIKSGYFKDGEPYDQLTAWYRLGNEKGVELKPEESYDIGTQAINPGYGTGNRLDSIRLSMYHTCVRMALVHGIKNLISIQDIKPLGLLQAYGNPFDTFDKLRPHPYGGPYDTIPAYSVVNEGIRRVREHDELVGRVFIDGWGFSKDYLLPDEYQPDIYSNKAVGLPEI